MVIHTRRVLTLNLCLMLWGLLLYVFSLTINAVEPQIQTPESNVNSNTSPEGRASSSFSQLLDSRSSLPVVNNHFVVDKDVSEIEIILTTNKFDTIKLLSPQGKIFIPSQTTPTITWQRIEKLYAIKVQNPSQGQWEVQGDMLSRPEVVVTSNLEMITPLFPNNMIRGETLALSAYLQENGQRITSGDLLKNMQIIATLQNVATSEVYKIYLKEDEKIHLDSYRGLFHYDYHLETLPGIYNLNIKAIGMLFQRERQQQFYVHDYPAKITTTVSAVNDQIQVDAMVTSSALDVPTIQLSAMFHNTDGSVETVIFDKKDTQNWQVIVPYNQDIDRMTVALAGFMKDSRAIQVVFPVVNIETLYERSFYELQQNVELKSKKAWQNVQEEVLATLLPFSIEKQRENLIISTNPFDEPELTPIRHYTTDEQELLKIWQSTIFPKSTEEILGIQSPDEAKPKAPIVTKEQLQAKELAAAKAKAYQEKVAAYMHKRKILIGVFVGFCFIFILMIAALIWIFVVPHRKKQEKVEQQPEQTEQIATPAQEVAKAEEPIEPNIKEELSDVKEEIEALIDEPIEIESQDEKPHITEVINTEPVENEQEIKEEKEEIKIDLNQLEATKSQETKEEEKEEIEAQGPASEEEPAVTTSPKEPPQGEQPTV